MSPRNTTGSTAPVVVVGLSSGVDSSVAAWILQQQGYSVVGVTLALGEATGPESSSSCCSPFLMNKAKAIADHLGIPHYAVDRIDEFQRQVVEYFVSEYGLGRTPNPCAKCNARVRFASLMDVARRLGAHLVATGHYAQLSGGAHRLTRGVDRLKDQSYVLAEVAPALLERCLFPVGGLAKTEVRRIANRIGVGDLVSEESQEICFVPKDDYRSFLRERLGARSGDIVDEEGNVLGRHSGTYNFTVGQRKGLGHVCGGPLYVCRIEAESGRVVASDKGAAPARVIRFEVSAIHGELPRGKVLVQFRSMGKPVNGRLDGPDAVILDEPARSVANGQTLVVYDGDAVVLGGTIRSTE